MTKDKDLKPCPFDGYKAVLAQSSDKTWFVMCLKCNCEIYGRDDGDDGKIWTKEAVIDYWNSRATPQQPSEPLKELDEDKLRDLARKHFREEPEQGFNWRVEGFIDDICENYGLRNYA